MGSLFKGKSIMVKKEGGGSRRMKLPAALSPVSKQIEMCAQLTFFSAVQDPTLRAILTTVTVSILISIGPIYITGMPRDASSRWA